MNCASGSKIPVWAVSILKGEGYSKTVVNLCVVSARIIVSSLLVVQLLFRAAAAAL
jgi:hypothetical protein